MSLPALRLLNDADFSAESYQLPAEKIIEGQPTQTVWMHYSDPTGQFHVGVWRGEVGKWQIRYTEEEWCEMLDGVSVVCDTHGHCTRLSAGMRFVIPRGFEGTWEVVQTTTKRFVIYERAEQGDDA